MTYQLILPMTGVGQRFVDAGYRELKPLISVDGKPIVEHVLGMFNNAERVVCIVSADHPQRDILISEILRIRPDALTPTIAAHKLGPGHAILEAKDSIDPNLPTLVSYCDWSGEWNAAEMIEQLKEFSGSILTYSGFHPHMMRNNKFAYVKKQGPLVVDIQEKQPFTETPMNEEASSGCYGFASGHLLINALEVQKRDDDCLNGEFYISLTYKNILRSELKVGTVLMDKFYQWGTPEDLRDWEYWNTTVNALPGSSNEALKAHNLILAAGKGSRVANIAKESKPNIEISGQQLWEYSAPPEILFESCKIITREEVGIVGRGDIELIIIPSVTEGQAISAKIGIEHIEKNSSLPVNVLSSDNAFTPEVFYEAFKKSSKGEVIVWIAKDYPISQLNPKQYAWINLKEKKVIKKNAPPNFHEWDLITGNFTFRNRDVALNLINELEDKNLRVNGEFYLDSLIELAFDNQLDVQTVAIRNFIAIGTPEEYWTYQYFRKLN